ncbi:helix-turn-helix transcriptional regulator [Dyadobacter arcticus]|uniref:AraC-like DNA-binding protein n=1 Tax=Dyadobacter arcticus TaxID=1078754 RepID=A0ABX0UM78_9BACT|nr:AraC family transcriptional regulator [Dyadobacter arcticus]NIJ54098.1 AraC-like DNA-binding protein [Dyadobacter arcticus]
MEERISRQFEKGKMTGVIWQCDGIRIGHSISTFTELTSFASKSASSDVVRMHFGVKGDYMFSYKQLNTTFDLVGGHHNIMYSKEFDMVVYNKTLELETFGVQFPKDIFIQFTQNASEGLKRFSDQIIAGKSAILSNNWGAIDSNIQQVLNQIIHCKYSDQLKKLFLLSKSIELLVLCADGCGYSENKTELFIKSKADKEKIIAVRDLINERVHCPPNLSEISRYVGLNEYKLKKGFKETFNNTVFGYLTDQRLTLARQYLLDSQQTAAEIALQLGYATPQHFNNAFKKKFGITPYSVRNNP